MEKDYWEDYYKSHNIPSEPSLFARFVLDNYVEGKNSSLLELGCGNGRDAIFFAKNNLQVLAVDQCKEEILFLSKINRYPNLEFKNADFTDLGDVGSFDCAYSRFTLHSVTEAGEDKTINWVYDHLNSGGKLLIEARGQKNEFYGLGTPVERDPDAFMYEGHYRRFINLDELSKKLEKRGFLVVLAEEKSGFAPFMDTNQIFIRIIAIKKIQ